MSEKTTAKSTEATAPSKLATVRVGFQEYNVDIVGRSISDVRNKYGKLLNLGPEMIPFIHTADGETKDINNESDVVVGEGETLEFVKESGSKGL